MAKKTKKQAFRFSAKSLHPKRASTPDVYRLQSLLAQYGYLQGAYRPGEYDETTRQAVSQFQSFYYIYPDEDGVCDAETTNLLSRPRCGLPDPPPGGRSITGRLAPFVTVGAAWSQTSLSYRFLNETPDLALNRQRRIIRDALARWADVSALDFTEVGTPQESDLSIAFHRGNHGDGSPFDDAGGPAGNTLAHAFFPPPAGGVWAGSLHFDEFETWKDQPGGPGILLYNVALHEIGHNLGLAHSQDSNAIMYAYYAEDRNDLMADDIAGIRSLYGAPLPGAVAVSPGETVSGHLPRTNAEHLYQVTLQNKLLVRLEGPAGEDFDVYLRHGEPVDRNADKYDEVSYGITSDELITVDDPKPGTYHILVHSYRGAGTYDLEVEVV